MSGNQLIEQVHRLYPDTIPIVLSRQADEKMLNQILGETSFHQYIPKPWDDEQLIELVSGAFDKYESQVINRALEIDTETLELSFDELTPERVKNCNRLWKRYSECNPLWCRTKKCRPLDNYRLE